MENTGLTLSQAGPNLASFIEALANDGRVIVSTEPLPPPDQIALSRLEALNERAQSDLPGEAPDFLPEAALWAATLLYQICQFIVCRDIGEAQITAAFATECPVSRGPATDWSADLTLRHLPALFRLTRHLSNGDPLVQELKTLAAVWPLSSVGVPDLPQPNLDSFIDHPALVRLYADRIIAAGDTSRLGNSFIDELLRVNLGIHHNLALELAAKLFPKANDMKGNAAQSL
jgi:hypothetical protein